MGLFGKSRAAKLGDAIGIDTYRAEMAAADPSYMPPKPAGLFGNPTVRNALGGFLGGMSEAMGGRNLFAEQLQLQQQAAIQDQLWQNRTIAQDALIRGRMKWDRENPTPTAFERELAAAGIDPTSPQGRELLQQKVRNSAEGAPVGVRNTDGTMTLYPRSYFGGAQQDAPPPAPVGKLRPYGGAGSGQRPF